MKKIILASLSAKFIHSSLALRYLTRFADNDKRHSAHHGVYHQSAVRLYCDELFRQQPDVILFSCYIWNVEMIKQLCPLLKKILPNCLLGAGGPEVSYESEVFCRKIRTWI